MEHNMTVVVEHVVREIDGRRFELAGRRLYLPITSYTVGDRNDAAQVPGEPILALRRVDNDPNGTVRFFLSRWKEALPMDSDDRDDVEMIRREFRIEWSEPSDANNALSACYPLSQEFVMATKPDENPPTGHWWFLLKREAEAGGSLAYHLCYLFNEASGGPAPGGGPGGVETYMIATSTDCSSTNYFHKLRCKLFKK